MLPSVGLHSLADTLRAAREAAGLSRADLDARAGVPRRTTERVELRGQEPHGDTLRALATALGTTPEALRGQEAPALASVVDGLVARHGARAVLEEIVRHV